MGGPGSGRGKSNGGGSRGSRGGRRPTLAQYMTPMEEETHLAEEEENGGQDHSNESDEDDLSCSIENEEGPQKVSLPDGAIPVPLFQQNRWPTWRKKCWSSWHIVHSFRFHFFRFSLRKCSLQTTKFGINIFHFFSDLI